MSLPVAFICIRAVESFSQVTLGCVFHCSEPIIYYIGVQICKRIRQKQTEMSKNKSYNFYQFFN